MSIDRSEDIIRLQNAMASALDKLRDNFDKGPNEEGVHLTCDEAVLIHRIIKEQLNR